MQDSWSYRSMIHDAARGLDALNVFIETRFELADMLEAEGQDEVAQEIRANWTEVWEALADTPRRAIAAELHELLMPTAPDDVMEYV